jgi:hypothetical protein
MTTDLYERCRGTCISSCDIKALRRHRAGAISARAGLARGFFGDASKTFRPRDALTESASFETAVMRAATPAWKHSLQDQRWARAAVTDTKIAGPKAFPMLVSPTFCERRVFAVSSKGSDRPWSARHSRRRQVSNLTMTSNSVGNMTGIQRHKSQPDLQSRALRDGRRQELHQTVCHQARLSLPMGVIRRSAIAGAKPPRSPHPRFDCPFGMPMPPLLVSTLFRLPRA